MPSPIAFATHVMKLIMSSPHLKGRLGLMAYSAFLCFWTTLALPTTPLEMIAGFNFSLAGSTVAGMVGKTCGSVLAFVIGRSMLGPGKRLLNWFQGKPPKATRSPSSVEIALEDALRKRPVQTIGMIRVAPLPSAVKNFGLSFFPSSVVPLPTFMLVTLVMNAPFSLAWSLAGNSASNLQEALNGGGEGSNSQKQLVMQFTVLAVLLGGLLIFSRTFKMQDFVATPSMGKQDSDESSTSEAFPDEDSRATPMSVTSKSSTKRSSSRSISPGRTTRSLTT